MARSSAKRRPPAGAIAGGSAAIEPITGSGSQALFDRLCRPEPDPPMRLIEQAKAWEWIQGDHSESEQNHVDSLALSFHALALGLLGLRDEQRRAMAQAAAHGFYPNSLEELRACYIRGLRDRPQGAAGRIAVIWWRRLSEAERSALGVYLALPIEHLRPGYVSQAAQTIFDPPPHPLPPNVIPMNETVRDLMEGIICPTARELLLGEGVEPPAPDPVPADLPATIRPISAARTAPRSNRRPRTADNSSQESSPPAAAPIGLWDM